MPLKREPCRNFQRGSCRYGDKCKFLHVTQQQPKTNAFGFGQQTGSPFQQTNMQQQQPKSNPFGFGVQTSALSNGAATGFKQANGFKPFENKWIRSSATAGSAVSSQPSEHQSQGTTHKCTDPGTCKQLIAEDSENERPLWKLTCYGHYKHLPCDISGDISYEELQAAAYDDARQGKSLQLIVERERNLLNSKVVEFESLLHNPYTVRLDSVHATQNSFPGAGASTLPLSAQNSTSLSVSSFGQLGSSLNPGLTTRTYAQSNTGFGKFHDSISTSNSFGNHSTSSGNAFGFGRKTSNQTGGNFSLTNQIGFSSSGMGNQNLLPSTPSASLQISSSTSSQCPGLFNQPSSVSNGVGPANKNNQFIDNTRSDKFSGDTTIWLKEQWEVGEVPEAAPPDEFIS